MTRRKTKLLGLFLAGLVLLSLTVVSPRSHTGDTDRQHVTVIDGDTVKVGGRIVNLYGIDCPELGQSCVQEGHTWSCGLSAMLELEKIIAINHDHLDCEPWDGEAGTTADAGHGSVCKVAHEDLAQLLVAGGYCVTVPGAFPSYQEAEREAKQAHLGIWGSDFVPPSEWRRRTRNAPAMD